MRSWKFEFPQESIVLCVHCANKLYREVKGIRDGNEANKATCAVCSVASKVENGTRHVKLGKGGVTIEEDNEFKKKLADAGFEVTTKYCDPLIIAKAMTGVMQEMKDAGALTADTTFEELSNWAGSHVRIAEDNGTEK